MEITRPDQCTLKTRTMYTLKLYCQLVVTTESVVSCTYHGMILPYYFLSCRGVPQCICGVYAIIYTQGVNSQVDMSYLSVIPKFYYSTSMNGCAHRAVAIGTAASAMAVPIFGLKFAFGSRLCSSRYQIPTMSCQCHGAAARSHLH